MPFLAGEEAISRGERQPIGFPHRFHGNEGDGQIEIRDHLLENPKLLKVFFPENGKVGLRDREEFHHHGGHPFEVAGAGFSTERQR